MKKLLLLTALFLGGTSHLAAQRMDDKTEHSKYIQAVDEYCPAPGQFVNELPPYAEGNSAQDMADKCTARLAENKGGLVSLGAYGGYITFHFDHSIANIAGKADFYVAGNAFSGSGEPGIVMVSKDLNKNGLPDDPWYELSGSADTDCPEKVTYNYQITYTAAPMHDIPWTDNQGASGTVTRNGFHKQEYFPQWMSSPLTFTGTCLPKNGTNTGGEGENQYWVLTSFNYGYVDNKSNTDSIANGFNIEWAVDAERNPVTLDFIDFVRVYTAVNQNAGWLGETSTEVTGAEDLHLEESIAAINNALTGIDNINENDDSQQIQAIYTIDGRRIEKLQHGLNILKIKNGKTKKIFIR